MSTEHEISRKVIFVKNVKRILESLKLIAAFKSKKLSLEHVHAKTFDQDISNNVSSSLLTNANAKDNLNILLAANKSLCGNFILNLNLLLKQEFPYINELENEKWILIGSKFPTYTKNIKPENIILNIEIHNTDVDLFRLSEQIFNLRKQFKSINLISWTTQGLEPIKRTLYAFEDKQYSNLIGSTDAFSDEEYKNINITRLFATINHAIVSSLTREEKNRLLAMDQAITNSDTMLKDLQIQFNQVRQASITNEINEIISGCEYA